MNVQYLAVKLIAGVWLATCLSPDCMAAPKTDWVGHLNFSLSAYYQGKASPVAVTTKSIIQRGLSDVAFITTNHVGTNYVAVTNHFSTGASLLLKRYLGTNVVVLNGLGTNLQIVVRQPIRGKLVDVDVDVSDSFSYTSGVQVTARNTRHAIETLTFSGLGITFQVSGLFNELHNANDDVVWFSAVVSGAGTVAVGTNAFPVVVGGTVTLTGGHNE